MKKHPYFKLTILAAVILLCLIIIQINWLQKANETHKAQQYLKLLQIAPSIAQEIDQEEHPLLHNKEEAPLNLDIPKLEKLIDLALQNAGFEGETVFAIFQDTTNGDFISNAPEYREAFFQSDTRQCLSCFVSFTILKKDSIDLDEINAENLEFNELPIQYKYSRPVDNYDQLPGSSSPGKIYWLSLYMPNAESQSIKSLTNIFFISIGLLLILLFLFYYILKAFSKHKKSSQVKEDFFNNLSHEFKTPLSSIHLASRVLRKSTDHEKNETYLDLIERESKNLEERLTKVLELSLLDNRELRLTNEMVDLHQIIKDIPNRFSVLSEAKNASITLALNATDAMTKGNLTQLSNCFYNLVDNAIKYGGEKVHIEISTKNQQGKIVISIKDNGPGIEEKYHAEIFDRFFRGQKDDHYQGQGFGIGLSYVKAIIEAYDGSIIINSEYRNGCEFIVSL